MHAQLLCFHTPIDIHQPPTTKMTATAAATLKKRWKVRGLLTLGLFNARSMSAHTFKLGIASSKASRLSKTKFSNSSRCITKKDSKVPGFLVLAFYRSLSKAEVMIKHWNPPLLRTFIQAQILLG